MQTDKHTAATCRAVLAFCLFVCALLVEAGMGTHQEETVHASAYLGEMVWLGENIKEGGAAPDIPTATTSSSALSTKSPHLTTTPTHLPH